MARKNFEHPERSGIRIAEVPNRVKSKIVGTSFQVSIPAKLTGKGRERAQFKTRPEALQHAEDRFLSLRKHGTSFADIPAHAQREAINAWALLEKAGVSFVEAVQAGLKVLRPEGGQRTVTQVFEELLASKKTRHEAGELDKTTFDDFNTRGQKISTAFDSVMVSALAEGDVRKWLNQIRNEGIVSLRRNLKPKPLSARSVLNYRNALAELLAYAKARRYASQNVMEHFTREDYKALGGERNVRNVDGIEIITVPEASRLVMAAQMRGDKSLLASLVLRLFCGLRTAEVCKLDWQDVHWNEDRPYVHISGKIAKKRRIRHVDIPENAVQWLKVCNAPASGPVVVVSDQKEAVLMGAPATRIVRLYCKKVTELTETLLYTLPDNATRHSYGSYHFALHGDALKTAAQMGHKQGDDVLFSHYRQLVRQGDAEAYFKLTPESEKAKLMGYSVSA